MRRGLAVLLITVVASISARAIPLTVLYTNDLHVRLDRLASLANAIAEERSRSDAVLLLDAGDTWQDHRRPTTNVWGSEQIIDWMNGVGYSAMALGNHDTYWGPKRLSELSSRSQFPLLCANWTPLQGESSGHEASTILHVNGVDILVIGLITAEFLPTPAFPRLQYRPPVRSLRRQIDSHEGEYDLVFVVGHLPINRARSIARQVPGIALFITGHSHERTPQPVYEGSTLIVQSGVFGQSLGRLRVEASADSAVLKLLSNELIAIERTPVDVRAGVLKLLGVLSAVAFATLVWIL